MGFSLVAFFENINTAVLANIAAAEDQHITEQGDDVVVPEWADKIMAVMAMGLTIVGAQVATPSLRRNVVLDISNLVGAVVPGADPNILWCDNAPIQLQANEEMNALIDQALGGAEDESVCVWLTDGDLAPVTGDIFTMKLTGTTTIVIDVWNQVVLTKSQSLPAGRYQCVGARFEGATCMFGRLIFPGQQHRPGAPGHASGNTKGDDRWRRGRLGVWGEFEHNQIPKAEFFCTTADTAQTVYLDLIKVA
jgi:hypothetical protein